MEQKSTPAQILALTVQSSSLLLARNTLNSQLLSRHTGQLKLQVFVIEVRRFGIVDLRSLPMLIPFWFLEGGRMLLYRG